MIGELHRPLIIDQRNSVEHRVEGATPSFSHTSYPVREVVDGNQIALLDFTTCPSDTKLDLGQLTVCEIPVRLESRFSGLVNRGQCDPQFFGRWSL